MKPTTLNPQSVMTLGPLEIESGFFKNSNMETNTRRQASSYTAPQWMHFEAVNPTKFDNCYSWRSAQIASAM